MDTSTKKRKYTRRSDEERIAELESRIAELREKQALKSKKDDPVLREIPKVQRRLRKFAQLAMDNGRPDIANSITAFTAGLERTLRDELKKAGREPAPAPEAEPLD